MKFFSHQSGEWTEAHSWDLIRKSKWMWCYDSPEFVCSSAPVQMLFELDRGADPLAKAEDAKRGMETGREGTVFTRESGTLARRSPLSALGQPWGDIL